MRSRSTDSRLLGIFIKLGQHIASLDVLPKEWTQTMAVLQDKCEPTPYEDIEALFLHDMGVQVAEIFDDFDKTPIGVASLAQVHVGYHKGSGQRVAVKVRLLLLLHHLLSSGDWIDWVTASAPTPRRILQC